MRMDAPNEPRILYCCWNSCIRLIVVVGAGGRAACHETSAAFETEQGAVKALTTDVLEHDVHAFLR